MDNPQTHTTQETRSSLARGIAGLGLAAKAVGLEDHRRMLRDAANRVRDSHRAQMEAAGLKATKPTEDDDMGDIHIGDLNMQAPPRQPSQSSGMSTAAKLAMAGAMALGSGGLGAATTAILLDRDPPPVVAQPSPKSDDMDDPDTDTQYELRISTSP